MILLDNGKGIAADSLAFWEENKHQIGSVQYMDVKFGLESEAYVCKTTKDKLGLEKPIYTCKITGERGLILLSGCTSGYEGEGPAGTKTILQDLGCDEAEAAGWVKEKEISISFEAYKPLPRCGQCHTCGGKITTTIDNEEWCPNCQRIQRPRCHGWLKGVEDTFCAEQKGG